MGGVDGRLPDDAADAAAAAAAAAAEDDAAAAAEVADGTTTDDDAIVGCRCRLGCDGVDVMTSVFSAVTSASSTST